LRALGVLHMLPVLELSNAYGL